MNRPGGAKHGNRKMGFFILFVCANWIIRKMEDGSEILPRTRRGSDGFDLV